jgi:peptide/nickel transport system substrate-binding protein
MNCSFAPIAFSLFLPAIGLAATAGGRPEEIGLSADVTTLDPHFRRAAQQLTVSRTPRIPDRGGREDAAHPGLAESWRALDATTWSSSCARREVPRRLRSDRGGRRLLSSTAPIRSREGGFSRLRARVKAEIADSHTLIITTAVPYGALPQDINRY